MLHAIEAEIERNFDFFQRSLAQFLPNERGRFALLRDCKVIQFYQTPFDAEKAGEVQFPDGLYSIQEVTESPVDLGFFTYAFDQRQAG
jgi:hypothetical protein